MYIEEEEIITPDLNLIEEPTEETLDQILDLEQDLHLKPDLR